MTHSAPATAMIMAAACAILSACGMTPEQEAAAIEEGLLQSPGAEEFWATVKQEYPDEFAELVGRVQTQDLSSADFEEQSKRIGELWVQEFFVQIGPDAVMAPAAELIQWSSVESDLYTSLQRSSVELCAAMTMGGTVTVDDDSTQAAAAITRRNTALVRAAAAGRDTPQTYEEPVEADFNTLGDSIAATGIDPQLQAALGSDEAMMALPPEDQCRIGVAVYAGLSALPDDEEPKMASYMLSPE